MKDFVTLACIMSLVFIAGPCLLFASMTWKVNGASALVYLGIAGGVLAGAVAWFYVLYQHRPAADRERSAFVEGQRLTRKELWVTRLCLAVAAIFLWASVDVISNGANGSARMVGFMSLISPFPIFGFVAIVATHGKWKLTLAALGWFVSSVAWCWTTFALMWD